MEKLGIDYKLLISQVVNFFLLFFILKKLLYKPILKLLDERRKKIAETLDNAAKLREELEKTEVQRKKMLADVRREGEIILKKQKDLAEVKREEMIEKAREEARKVTEEARKQLNQEKESMIKDVSKRVSELSISLTQKMLGDLDNETQHKVLEGMIKNLGKNQ